MKTKQQKKPKVNVITMGCSKNLVDSENLMVQLEANAFEVAHDTNAQQGEIVVINTCGFIDLAKEESIQSILTHAELKKAGKLEKLFVTGCLSQRYKEDLAKEIPEVDAWFGTMELPSLLEKLEADYKHDLIGERGVLTTPDHYAYLKISEGCNRTCAFCAIPLMRGKHRSKTIEACVTEAKNLVKRGVKEVMLIAQELTYYGLDLYKERALPKLLRALNKVEGLEWIRLHYAYPSKFPLEIIDAIHDCEKVCNYLDMPLQHANDAVLKAMRRQVTRKETSDLILAIRNKMPNLALRTTMLVGFPGETEEDFQDLIHFVKEMRFDRLGVFTYSHEEGTSGYELKDDVPEETKQRRASDLMEIQEAISEEINQKYVGQVLKVLIDRKEGDYFIGRSEFDSPEVDNEVVVSAKDHYLRVGDFAQIKIDSATAFDLNGSLA